MFLATRACPRISVRWLCVPGAKVCRFAGRKLRLGRPHQQVGPVEPDESETVLNNVRQWYPQ